MNQPDVNVLLQQLATMLGGANSVNQTQAPVQQTQQFQPVQQPNIMYPPGVIGVDHNGHLRAVSVDDLYDWDATVFADDGGTHKGLRVKFVSVVPREKRETDWSQRDQFMARFEISKAGSKNPMNEVVNVFIKDEVSYRPYMNPLKWSHTVEVLEFKSDDPDDDDRTARLNMISFAGELISDSIERKVENLMERFGGLYKCYHKGRLIAGDDEEIGG